MPKKNTQITVAYWSTKGLGAPLRQMVLYSGVPLKCIFYKTTAVQTQDGLSVEGSHWHLGAKPALQKINPLINLPYVEVHDADQKIVVAQSIACMTLLARELDMQGSDRNENSQCEQLLCEIMDVRNKMVEFAYAQHENQQQAAAALFDATMVADRGSFKKIERLLESKKSSSTDCFLVGSAASAADFALFEMLDQYACLIQFFELIPCENKNPVEILEACDKSHLANLYENFRHSPQMEKYFQSLLNDLPFNNKSASFGSGKGGERWNPELDVDSTPECIQFN